MKLLVVLCVALFSLLMVACGGSTTSPAAAPVNPTSAAAPNAQPGGPTLAPGGAATGASVSPITLNITDPQDGVVVDTVTITIKGQADPDVALDINGDPVEVDTDGNFSYKVTLNEGGNTIDITVTDDSGNEVMSELTVYYSPASC